MTRGARVVVVAACVLAVSSCGRGGPPGGGAPEQQLAAATMAADVANVSRLLASGADPNRIVRVGGHRQSPWFLALRQVRPGRSPFVEIVTLMVKAGANPDEAWGTDASTVGAPQSAWRRFSTAGGTRQAGFGPDTPIHVAMSGGADVVRALIAAGANPRYATAALVHAVEAQDGDTVHALVEAGVDVNAQPGAITPLVAAIEARDVELMTYLEAHGARERP